ncbi:type I-E CRISPR-associated protein Cse2/CasB [Bifidobacterium platyrrhinorum]|uniref:Type I-E CRISPR-associated protein Cse2/CasB n=1 Tax=Bifidobacterium platyrrhinorum TaxID=2661628 RepID=A0A6L9SU47_9BIFI|nr:type I-E CRISPR-associated protein Cse2/CasB [Bifidobacterium platyrrhinorum]NEG56108.1 hypothetical protein [Bifidobacterium platyrrhinorum]
MDDHDRAYRNLARRRVSRLCARWDVDRQVREDAAHLARLARDPDDMESLKAVCALVEIDQPAQSPAPPAGTYEAAMREMLSLLAEHAASAVCRDRIMGYSMAGHRGRLGLAGAMALLPTVRHRIALERLRCVEHAYMGGDTEEGFRRLRDCTLMLKADGMGFDYPTLAVDLARLHDEDPEPRRRTLTRWGDEYAAHDPSRKGDR